MFESVTVTFTLALAGGVLVIAAAAVATVPSVAAAKVAMIAPGTSVAALSQSCFGSTFCTRAFASLAATTTVTSAGRPWRCWPGSGPKRLRPPPGCRRHSGIYRVRRRRGLGHYVDVRQDGIAMIRGGSRLRRYRHVADVAGCKRISRRARFPDGGCGDTRPAGLDRGGRRVLGSLGRHAALAGGAGLVGGCCGFRRDRHRHPRLLTAPRRDAEYSWQLL